MFQISVLGPIEVRRDGQLVPVPGGKTSELLVRLALEAGQLVRTDRLVDDLWAAGAVNTRRNTLQSKIARLRRALGDPSVIASGDGGYTLAVDPSEVDALAVLRHAVTASRLLDAGDDRGAADLCASTLQMYRGEVLQAAGDGEWVTPHRARLVEARMKLVETQFSARLRLGDVGDVIGELEAAVATYPFQEGLWELLITALYRAGRQADALATYQRVRHLLAEELGLDPGPQLQQLEQRILVHDASLGVPDRTARPLELDASAGNLPSMSVELVGRETELAALCDLLAGDAARRDRRTRRHREDGRRDRDRPKADGVERCRARWRLVGEARIRHDGRRSRRRVDRGAERHRRRGGAVRAAQGQRRAGDPRQLRARRSTRPRRSRSASSMPRPGCGSCAPARFRSTSTARPCSSSHRLRCPTPSSCSPVAPARDARTKLSARPTTLMRELCRSLDGLPLAIELAAARTKTLSIEEITRRLDDRFNVLSDPTSRKPERRRALRATIGWSYELLFPDDKRGLWALAAFAGGAPLPAVEFVLEALDVPASAAIDVIGRLASRSLVIVDDDDPSLPVRYRLLDSIRAFALEAMADAGLTERALAAHAAWFADAAASSTQGVRSSRQAEHLSFARAERANIDAALAWSAAHDPLLALDIVNGFGWAWIVLGDSRGAQRILTALDAAGDAAPDRDRAAALLLAAWIEASTGHLELARDHIAAAAELADAIDDVDLQARCCYYLAYVVSHHGEFGTGAGADRSQSTRSTTGWTGRGTRPRTGSSPPGPRSRPATRSAASKLATRSSTGWRMVDDPWLHVRRDAMLGELARIQHRFDDAVLHIGRAAETSRRLGFLQTEAYQVSSLGRAQCQAGDYETGAATLELAIEKAEATGDVRLAALARVHLGRVLRALGQRRASADGARSGDRVAPRRRGWRTGRARRVPARRDGRRGSASPAPRIVSSRSSTRPGATATPTSRSSPSTHSPASPPKRATSPRRGDLCEAADRRMDAASHFITELDRTDARSVRQLA